MKLHFDINQEQYDILLGLRYWISDLHYIKERYGDIPEIESVRKSINALFDEADAAEIPFWVQNIICIAAENWRDTKERYLYQQLEEKNVNCAAVSCR